MEGGDCTTLRFLFDFEPILSGYPTALQKFQEPRSCHDRLNAVAEQIDLPQRLD